MGIKQPEVKIAQFTGQGLSLCSPIQPQGKLPAQVSLSGEGCPVQLTPGGVKLLCVCVCVSVQQDPKRKEGWEVNDACLASPPKLNYQISHSFLSKGRVRARAEGMNATLTKYLPHRMRLQEWGEGKISTPNRLGSCFSGSVTLWNVIQSPTTLAIVYFLFLSEKETIW